MSTIEIICIASLGAITLASTVLNFFQKQAIKAQEDLLIKYSIKLDEEKSKTDGILEYCLRFIMVQAIESEDYETAEKCKNLLSQLASLSCTKK